MRAWAGEEGSCVLGRYTAISDYWQPNLPVREIQTATTASSQAIVRAARSPGILASGKGSSRGGGLRPCHATTAGAVAEGK